MSYTMLHAMQQGKQSTTSPLPVVYSLEPIIPDYAVILRICDVPTFIGQEVVFLMQHRSCLVLWEKAHTKKEIGLLVEDRRFLFLLWLVGNMRAVGHFVRVDPL
uniref:Uncharacterized protein n=1 Tax=Eutreptiella gymnastica TaxID=73025 RepID=A0A7S1J0U1_9EUGL|mmetsp:Transcript_57858/g.103292  ORF Transcript_57858/g.103292 Transcript_57858/m.103292 type:complete len:104 (+) Transcript_57858:83-394(+)